MNTYRSQGRRINYTNSTGSDIAVNAVVVVGNLIGIAVTAITNAASGALEIWGEHSLDAVSAEAWGQGQRLFWNTSSSKLTADQTAGYPAAGVATKAKAAAATKAAVLLNVAQDVIPSLTLTGTDDADGTGTMDIQVKDAAGNNLAERCLIRTWIAAAEFSEPDPQTDFAVTVGEQMKEIEANADYEAICDATGLVTMNIDKATDGTLYVMAEIDGRIYTGSVAITGN